MNRFIQLIFTVTAFISCRCANENEDILMPLPMRDQLARDIDNSANDLVLVECFLLSNLIFIQVRPDWSPLGSERFIELVEDGYYDNTALFRAIDKFLIQFGLSSDDKLREKWFKIGNIKDDPPLNIKFEKGIMSFAGSGPDSRNTQIFFTMIEEGRKHYLGTELWETPFGQVIGNIELLNEINTEYGDKPNQQEIWKQGYKYLKNEFPNLTYIDQCRMVSQKDIESIKDLASQMENSKNEL